MFNKQKTKHVAQASFFTFLLALPFGACTDYQEEFENSFEALEYADESGDLSSSSEGLSSSSYKNSSSSEKAECSSSEETPLSSSTKNRSSSSEKPYSSAEEESSSSEQSSSSSSTPSSSPEPSSGSEEPSSSSVVTITGCQCNSVNISPDVFRGEKASWAAFGCKSTEGEISYEWKSGENVFGEGTTSSVNLIRHKDSIAGVSFTATDKISSVTVLCEKAIARNSNVPAENWGTVTDTRDNQTYLTVKIGNLWWMAQNLNYADLREPNTSFCYNGDTPDCKKYGRYYVWGSAMDAIGTWSKNGEGCRSSCSPTYPVQGICPTGWHLPSQSEFDALRTATGGENSAGKNLKATSEWGGGNGTDSYGFAALPAGDGDIANNKVIFDGVGEAARFWSSTPYDGMPHAYKLSLEGSGEHIDRAGLGIGNTSIPRNVRCVKAD